MAISVFNTLTRRKEPLAPIRPGEVGIYLCGPTVYDDCHIGHVAGPIMFDAVACWLRARDFRVRLVNNITDIDDKIINRSRETGEPWQAITRRYTDQYLGYLAQLKVSTISDHPRCSDYIPQMVAYIAELVQHDRAYVAADGVYFDIEKQAGYGKLSGRKLDEMIAGARIERDSGLRHPADFALWKLVKPGEPSWDSPWGAGRPGWHIECSVMSTALLGENFDIHAGGDDLKFPHHENEIAQAEAHSGCYANCWMHNGLLQYEGTKIGKSDPRMKDPEFRKQFRLDWILSSYGPSTVRFLILQGHYRRPSDFTSKQLEAQRKALGRLHRLLGPVMAEPGSPTLAEIERATASDPILAPHLARFAEVMDDDFRTGDAIAELFTVAKLETPAALRLVRDLGRLLGLFQPGDEKDTQAETAAAGGAADQQVAALMELVLPLRQQVRLAKDFAASDRIRDGLAKAGIAVKDAKEGSTWAQTSAVDDRVAALMAVMLDLRQRAREQRDFAASDQIRDGLGRLGIVVQDAKDGATWSFARSAS